MFVWESETAREEVSYRDAPPIIHNKKLNIFMKMNKKDAYIYEKNINFFF